MSLRITGFSLTNFRSYDDFMLSDVGELTILYGPNAVGKTNIIEALQLLTSQSSFRNASAEALTKKDRTFARVNATISDGNRLLNVELSINKGRRSYQVNDKTRSVKSLKGLLPSIIFSPDDLNLAKSADSFRRHELDHIGSQVNANYYQIMQDYEKILRQRNRLLKDDAPIEFLESLNEVFDKVGTQLSAYRKAMLTRMTPFIVEAYRDISGGEELSVEYCSSWDDAPTLTQKLYMTREDERARGTTLVGPHRDKIQFKIDGMITGAYASQGQQRSVVLALKMAEVQLIEEMKGQKPILLLDDVMSELDESRRTAMVEKLLPATQTFITTANLDYFNKEIIEKARVVDIEKTIPVRWSY